MRAQDLLCPKPAGLYCPPGDFYIDPVRPVARALITHGHSDHARAGHTAVMATAETLAVMEVRHGPDFAGSRQEVRLGEPVAIDGVSVTFHPAGHVLGSAQIAVEANGLRIVASGDYKRRPDPTCLAFEPVACDVFITEATFALPVFRHPDDRGEIGRLLCSLRQFPERAHIVGAYPLGKAQRLIALIRAAGYEQPIYLHGGLERLVALYREFGADFGELKPATLPGLTRRGHLRDAFAGAIVVAPPSALSDRWARRFPEPLSAFASGPLVISDHCDWRELTQTILEVGAPEVWVTHGRDDALVRWCELEGIRARPLQLVGYEDEAE
jgi:putative mRNA 3-end processing factor